MAFMEPQLKDLGQTFAVGSLVVFGLVYILRLCHPRWVPTILSGDGAEHSRLHQSGLLIVIVLSLGVVFEEISDDVAGRKFNPPISTICNWLFDSKNELRFRSFFEVHPRNNGNVAIKGKGIYRDLYNCTRFMDHFKESKGHAWGVEQIRRVTDVVGDGESEVMLDETTPQRSPNQVQRIIDLLFYTAKNFVYQHDSYNREVREIESRMRFLRATVFTSYTICLVYCTVFTLCWIPVIARRLRITRNEQWRLAGVAILYFAFLLLLREAYRSSCESYNSRVIGYYLSLLQSSIGNLVIK